MHSIESQFVYTTILFFGIFAFLSSIGFLVLMNSSLVRDRFPILMVVGCVSFLVAAIYFGWTISLALGWKSVLVSGLFLLLGVGVQVINNVIERKKS